MKKTIDFAMVLDFFKWQGQQDSNLRMRDSESRALPTWRCPYVVSTRNSIAAEVSDVKKKFGFLQNYFASAKYGSVSR